MLRKTVIFLLVLILFASVLIQVTGQQGVDIHEPGALTLNYGFPILFIKTSGAYPFDFKTDGKLDPEEQDFSKAALSARLFACPRPCPPSSLDPIVGVRRKGVFLWEHRVFFPCGYVRRYYPPQPDKNEPVYDSSGAITNVCFYFGWPYLELYTRRMDTLVRCFRLAESKSPETYSALDFDGKKETIDCVTQDVEPYFTRSLIFNLIWTLLIWAGCFYFWIHQSQHPFFSKLLLLVSAEYILYHILAANHILDGLLGAHMSFSWDNVWLYHILYALNMIGVLVCLFCFCQVVSAAYRWLRRKTETDTSPETENETPPAQTTLEFSETSF